MNPEDIQTSSALSLETMELQWKDYVTKLRESGTLSSALAMADVSGSMWGTPMQVHWYAVSRCKVFCVLLCCEIAHAQAISIVLDQLPRITL